MKMTIDYELKKYIVKYRKQIFGGLFLLGVPFFIAVKGPSAVGVSSLYWPYSIVLFMIFGMLGFDPKQIMRSYHLYAQTIIRMFNHHAGSSKNILGEICNYDLGWLDAHIESYVAPEK